MTSIIYIHIDYPFLLMLHIKFGFDWPSGFRGDDVLNIMVIVMYDSYLSKDVHSVLVNFPREYAHESMMLYI